MSGVTHEVLWVGVLALLGMGYLIFSVEKFKRSVTGKGEPREITPQPLLVSPAVRYATTGECAEKHKQIDQRLCQAERRLDAIDRKLEEKLDVVLKAGEERARGIHRRLNALLAAQNRVLGKLGLGGVSEDSEAL